MWVVKLGGSLCEQAPETSPLRDWLDLLVCEGAGRVVIVPGGGKFADAVRGAQAQWCFDDLTAHNMALLAMSQTAPLPSVFFSKNHSLTKLPSFLNTWIRLLMRSQT